MSKVLKVVAAVAGVVAVVATGGAALAGTSTFLGASAGTLSSIASIAGVVSAAAAFGANLLAKPPPARGSLNSLIIQTDAQQPYAMGRTYFGGVLRHAAAYGPEIDDVPNPYLSRVVVYSGAGPIDAIEALQVDYSAVGPYYSGFLYTTSQLGLCPEASALSAQWSGFPNWSASHKLSGQAAAMWNFKFDRDGKKFASGLPQTGALMRGVKVYDPRLDSTYSGGVGPQRISSESTWAYSENPALHALAYAYGRFQNGKKVFGVGLPLEAIDLPSFVAWANVCDANNWKISGVIFEPDDRWKNLKDIMAAGGAEPIFSGAKLSVKYHAPRVSLDTVTAEDLADGEVSITAMRSYRDRINTIVPKWRSEAHNWEYIAGADLAVSTYITEDGEVKKDERQFNLVADGNQAAQLATYELLERRELGMIELQCGPRLLAYRPGEVLTINLPEEGLTNFDAVILNRQIDPGTMGVRFTLLGETAAKHAFALGRTATPPPTPSLTPSQEDRDGTAGSVVLPLTTATVRLYQRTTTNTPPGVATGGFATYTFATGGITGQPSGWTIDVPSSGGDYVWSIQAVASSRASTAVIYNTAWTAPVIISQSGRDASVLTLSSTAQSFTYDAAGNPSPSSQTISFTANLQNLAGTASWSAMAYNSSGGAVGAITLGGTGNTRTMSNTQFTAPGATAYAVVTASLSGFSDTVSIVKLKDGAAGTDAIVGFLTNEAVTLAATADGTVSDFSGAGGTFKVFQGTTDRTTSATFSVVASSGVTVSINATTGVYSVSAMSANSANATLQAVYGGVTIQKIVSLSKSIAGAAGSPGAAGATAISAYLTNEAITLFSYADGTVVSYGPATGDFKVFAGTVDVSSSFTLSTQANPQVLGVTYTGQTYSITSGLDTNEDTALLTIRASGTGAYSGIVLDKVVSLAKARGGYEIVSALPTENLFEGRVVYLTTDDKLYRYDGTDWVRSVDGADILANSIASNSIAAGAITAGKIAAGAITALEIAGATITGDKIAANTITANKLNVTQLDSVSATIGLLRTATSGARMELESNQIRVYDAGGLLRVLIGVW